MSQEPGNHQRTEWNGPSLKGRRALVTGASKGIGRGLAVAMARAGADVHCVSRNESELQRTQTMAAEHGVRATYQVADLVSSTGAKLAVASCVAALGGVDIVLNNAAAGLGAMAVDTTEKIWDEVMAVGLRSPFIICREAGRHMIAQGSGKIINISSVLGVVGKDNIAAYGSAKHGLIGLTKCLGVEWAPHNVQVNALAPGWIRTEMTADYWADAERSKLITDRTPARRWGEVDDLVGAAVFLASPASDFVTATVLLVDGGFTAI